MASGQNSPTTNVSQSDMAALKRILNSLDESFGKASNDHRAIHACESREAIVLARRLKSARDGRSRLFQQDLFGEPAWDMMLALYIARGEGYRLSISELSHRSGVSATTALRWINIIIDLGLARRIPNTLDARSAFIESTDLLSARMDEYLRGLLDGLMTPKPLAR